MSRYRQLSLEERCSIARLHEAGQSLRQIAAALDRQPSTISRELKRNSGTTIGYRPAYADARASARRWTGSRMERDDALRDQVLAGLARGWSPEQVAGRMALERGRPVISHESIYRFVHGQLRRTNDGAWRHYPPRAKARRGRRGKRGGSPASFIQQRRPLGERPAQACSREQPGHWEADYMLFSACNQNLLVVHERTSRTTLVARTPNRKAETTARSLADLLSPMPPPLRRTVAFDNPVLSACLGRQSKGAPSSPSITSSAGSASPPSSATRMPPGRKGASKTPSDDSGGTCLAAPT